MTFSTIHFSDLSNFNDSNSLVVIGLDLNESDLNGINNFFANKVGLSKGKNITGAYRILGNVLGDEGRTDWLFVFDNENVEFNPIKRLLVAAKVKWTSDFIDNFADDYAPAA